MLVLFTTSGCGLLLDLDPPAPQAPDGGANSGDAALDGALPNPCATLPNGAVCDDTMMDGPALICRDEACVASVCGDSVIEVRTEQCDDGNEMGNDGCEPVTCEFTCTGDMGCPAPPSSCLAPHCAASGCSYVIVRDGETCGDSAGFSGGCEGGMCRPAGCGDLNVDMGEQCDDGNAIDGDGCDSDCTFSCVGSDDCSDGDPCNGDESCSSNVCVTGMPIDCGTAPDACRVRSCVPFAGCRTVRIDDDGDGYSPIGLGSCGRDCNDGNPLVSPDSTEVCSNDIDDDCNGETDEGAALADWYADRDGDGYGDPRTVVRSCVPVPGHVLRAGDCFDAFTSVAAVVNPAQTAWFTMPYDDESGASSFDYDCSGSAEKRFSAAASTCARLVGFSGCGGDGWRDGDPGCGVSDDWQTCRGVTILGLGLVCNTAPASTRTQECH